MFTSRSAPTKYFKIFFMSVVYCVLCAQVLVAHAGVTNWTQQPHGMYGGKINILTTDIKGNIYAGTGGGIFKSSDGGLGWIAINNGLTDTDIRSIVVDGNGNIYAGTGRSGLFKSNSGGDNWIAVSSLQKAGTISNLAIDASGNLYAGTSIGIFKSTDSINWTAFNNGFINSNLLPSLSNITIRQLLLDSNGNIYAAIGTGIASTLLFKSSTNSDNWMPAYAGIQYVTTNGNNILIINSLVNDTRNNVLYASTLGGIYKSSNGGNNWSYVGKINNSSGSSIAAIALILDNIGNLYAATGNGVFKSGDSGFNWLEMDSGISNTSIFSIVVDPNGSLYAGTGNGIFKSSNNGSNWSDVNLGLTAVTVNTFTKDSNGNIYAGTGGGVFKSTDAGSNWKPINNGLTNTSTANLSIDLLGNLYAGTSNSGIFKSTNGGNSWISLNVASNVNIAVDSKNNLYAVGSGGTISKSTDSGNSWANIGNVGIISRFPGRLIIDRNDNLYLGTSSGMFKSADGASNWIAINKGLPNTYILANAFINLASIIDTSGTIYISIANTGSLPAGTPLAGGIYKSSDGGNNWTLISNSGGIAYSSSGATASTQAFGIDANGNLIAATTNGVFKNNNSGNSWTAFNDGLTNPTTIAMLTDASGNLYVGTDGSGIFKYRSNTNTSSGNLDSDKVFDWAERTYPQLFAPASQPSQTASSYYFRYYAKTNSFLAVNDGHLFYLGPATNNTIADLGLLTVWLAQVK